MSRFTIHTAETAPEASRPVLEAAKGKYGRVPNLIGALSESPAAARAYLQMSELAAQTSFTPTERHVVWFTINAEHGCDYCMAAHTAIAASEGIDAGVVETAREVGEYDDRRLETLRRFTLRLVRERGWVGDEAVEAFVAEGFNRAQVLELVTLIAHKVISNYTNHLVSTPVDAAFSRHAWQPPARAAV